MSVLLLTTGCAKADIATNDPASDSDSDGDSDSDTDSDSDSDTDSDSDSDTDSDADSDSDTDTNPDCVDGGCCDTDAQEFEPDTFQCGSTAVDSEYECVSTDCAGDAQERQQYQYCTGASSSCDMTNLVWEAWSVTDCTTDQLCETDGSTYSQCTDCPGGCIGGVCQGAQETVNFPAAGDYFSTSYMWHAGDYVEGSKTTSLTSVTDADIHLVILDNVLSCDTQDVNFIINGTTVGNFSISSGQYTIDQNFSFASISGPVFTLRYQTISTVASGCGSASYSSTGSTVTFTGS